jgi:nucleotide-binding universal stress UspA family protein
LPAATKTREENTMVKKVLIATDGSSHARKAVEIGAALAASRGAEVVLVHVLLRDHLSENLRHMAEVEFGLAEGGKTIHDALGEIPDGRFPAVNLLPRELKNREDVLYAVADLVLSDAERVAREHGATRIVKEIEDGKAATRILEVAKDTGADMIVSGARGLSDVEALMVGSVSHKLSHLSPVTCVTVR